MTKALDKLLAAVVQVGDGRGFIVEHESERYVLTAAHCLPRYPDPSPGWDSTYQDLIGRRGQQLTVWAECLFVDPVADLAVLTTPDGQELYEQAEAYSRFVEASTPLQLSALEPAGPVHMLSRDTTTLVTGQPNNLLPPWGVRMQLWVHDVAGAIQGGMSGSPIVTDDGCAVSLVSHSSGAEGGPNPWLATRLPAWIAPR